MSTSVKYREDCWLLWHDQEHKQQVVPITGSFDVVYPYYDPLPTNCVAEPVCPERRHYGYYNLAVFFAGCNLDCLFCQNIEHKYMISHGKVHERTHLHSVQELVEISARSRIFYDVFYSPKRFLRPFIFCPSSGDNKQH